MKAPDDETEAEKEAGVYVHPDLEFHDWGCVKRYDAVPDNGGQCMCEIRMDATATADHFERLARKQGVFVRREGVTVVVSGTVIL